MGGSSYGGSLISRPALPPLPLPLRIQRGGAAGRCSIWELGHFQIGGAFSPTWSAKSTWTRRLRSLCALLRSLPALPPVRLRLRRGGQLAGAPHGSSVFIKKGRVSLRHGAPSDMGQATPLSLRSPALSSCTCPTASSTSTSTGGATGRCSTRELGLIQKGGASLRSWSANRHGKATPLSTRGLRYKNQPHSPQLPASVCCVCASLLGT